MMHYGLLLWYSKLSIHWDGIWIPVIRQIVLGLYRLPIRGKFLAFSIQIKCDFKVVLVSDDQ